MSLFIPDLILKDITKITVDLLKQHNISGIILDVDNTLTTHGSQEVGQNILDWLKLMSESGFKLMIVSNNTYARIKPFADKLELEFVSMGCKPMTFGFKQVKQRFGLQSKQIAVVGDQIYTDIVGGNLEGMFTILVSPFEKEDELFFRIKRKLEARHINRYHKLKNKKEN